MTVCARCPPSPRSSPPTQSVRRNEVRALTTYCSLVPALLQSDDDLSSSAMRSVAGSSSGCSFVGGTG